MLVITVAVAKLLGLGVAKSYVSMLHSSGAWWDQGVGIHTNDFLRLVIANYTLAENFRTMASQTWSIICMHTTTHCLTTAIMSSVLATCVCISLHVYGDESR